ncbi:hypothetical protein RSAG8_13738, partial [Rhizoctonia solani AG-8 WAC10335]
MRRRWSDSYGQTAGAIGIHLLLGVFSSSQEGYLEGAWIGHEFPRSHRAYHRFDSELNLPIRTGTPVDVVDACVPRI